MATKEFRGKQESVTFYEYRYTEGYMSHWSDFEKSRLFNLIKELNLPEKGVALDFGCGRGIFTDVIRRALPDWKIYGCDISHTAIENAQKNFPDINFFPIDQPLAIKADFIHSHHVLEHAFNEVQTAKEMAAFATDKSSMLHSFPINHPGSLEYNVSARVKDGLDTQTGKFFFEDHAHLRRMNIDHALKLFAPFNFKLKADYYANQYYGALNHISEGELSGVMLFTTISRAKDFLSAIRQLILRAFLFLFWYCNFITTAFLHTGPSRYGSLKKILQLIGFLFSFWFAFPIKMLLTYLSKHEWKKSRNKKNGSELFLIIER